MDDLDRELQTLVMQLESNEPALRQELDLRARRVRRRRRGARSGAAALVVILTLFAIVSLPDGHHPHELQVTSSTTLPKSARKAVESAALPSKYLFNQISATEDGLTLTGEVTASPARCVEAFVNANRLEVSEPTQRQSCGALLAAKNVGIASTWLNKEVNNVNVSVGRPDPATGRLTHARVVMTYTHFSDTAAVTAAGGQWLWVYDVATTRGPELLQISAASGEVVDTVAMPTVYRPIMAANDDGVWLGPSITGTGAAALYSVASRSKTARVVLPGQVPSSETKRGLIVQSVCWLVGSGHDLWAGVGPTCAQQTIRRYHDSDLRPLFAVRDHGYAPTEVVGDRNSLWTVQWAPPLGAGVSAAPRSQHVIRIDPSTGSETVVATLPPLAVPISLASGGLVDGQAALFGGSLYLLEPPFRQGGWNGYSHLVRVELPR